MRKKTKKIIVLIIILIGIIITAKLSGLLTIAPTDYVTYVKFRTLDSNNYGVNTWISYEPKCNGMQLISYGYIGETNLQSTTIDITCASEMPKGLGSCGANPLLLESNLPGGWLVEGEKPSLWRDSKGALCICDSGPGTGSLKYVGVRVFTSSDIDACTTGGYYPACVSATSVSAYASREVNCPAIPVCTDTCSSLEKQCGMQTICGNSVNCGTCQENNECNAGACISTPPPITCGNNIIESGEICDGNSLAQKTCENFNLASGNLKCKSDCLDYDLSLCQAPPVYDCSANWQCSSWGVCKNAQQIRQCTDMNNCGKLDGKPLESASCIPIEPIKTITSGECNSDETKCIRTNHYFCEKNKWVNKGEIAGRCGYIAPCIANECVGDAIYACTKGELKFEQTCDFGCKEAKCKIEKPIIQYILILLVLIVIGGIIWVASRR